MRPFRLAFGRRSVCIRFFFWLRIRLSLRALARSQLAPLAIEKRGGGGGAIFSAYFSATLAAKPSLKQQLLFCPHATKKNNICISFSCSDLCSRLARHVRVK